MCCDNIHPLEGHLGLICFVLNIFVPPLGTFIHACMGPKTGRGLIIGVLQFLTGPIFLIGYIWAVIYGYIIWRESVKHQALNGGAYSSHY